MAVHEIIQNNWEPITAIAGVALTALSTLGLINRPRAKGREKLKLNLDIYNLMDGKDEYKEYRESIKGEINDLVERIYKEEDTVLVNSYRILGVFVAVAFGWWSIEILRTEDGAFAFSWWVLLTGYWCLVGLFMLAASLNPSLRHKLIGMRDTSRDAAEKSTATSQN